ncbi:UDP:flavonoid glycosyltransferase YjiC, YdhE family [Methylobacterium phyllostachyos]|uniref:UDP:flavonoid glycosyltransferase YjiC, YdhE family n=1 Tax=Methylobacterium phyllostachyos TaxID=582672 RepID=A0A1H0H164_9HYPH|nr:nucleotide disphospho-sugar-binding domain-containing protein [Methylobacterium phyllostachyos]SDO12889.1 UDP:flavonoid glycosyltransferase YjiC, YdhE family [Methylobacterium phyllostachyos]
MKILIAATPLTGHVNPLLAVGRAVAARGDDVLVLSDARFQAKFEAAGLRFTAYPDDGAAEFRATDLPAGPERYRREFERRFIDPMPIQAAALRRLIDAEAPEVIVAGSMVLGVLPLLLDTAPRPPIAVVNVSFLFLDRPDHAPIGLGLPPAQDRAERIRYAALKAGMDAAFANPVRAYADGALAKLGLPPLPSSLPHSIVVLPDLFLQPTVPGFEYDYGALPPGIRFIGLLQPPTPPAPLPEWWPELEAANAAGKPVVLVTQGTLANADFGELVEPTLAALADRNDLLVVATTGGRPVAALRGPIPANARVSSFLPFRDLLPRVSALVTNGGYGSVSQALAAGVPIVSAGLTEDKAEVNARVGWSGAGLNLATNDPAPDALRNAVVRVLTEPGFRQRAMALQMAFASRDAMAGILTAIDDLARSGPMRGGRTGVAVPVARSA